MSAFVKVVSTDGVAILVNPRHVVSIIAKQETSTYTHVELVSGTVITTEDDAERLRREIGEGM